MRTTDRTLFVKGLPLDHPRVWTQKREEDINRCVRGIAPELHWHIQDDGWSLLGFEYAKGGHADFAPGSPDLPAVMATMARLADVPAPDIELKSMPHRLRTYVDDPADLSWFTGSSLLHTEWNPHNVLMTDRGATLVDWGWASTGAAWIDPALWLLWLIAQGHAPGQAEREAAAHPAWVLAPPAGLDALARVQSRLWDSIADQSTDNWAKPMQRAAQAWAEHRTAER
ncbi:aminoglycoside phosphotransferase [Streptomyces luteolifulvus]|uniref:Aminoglycoside phosphotransferase n=1 Tax=Streptomyces luteolifulvus TaxID=2615112 RepID=A0A6H9US94_9ACTN|nr:aminoglycoside phosphotransferase [Streptomyces luteolifulvus]